MNSFFDQIIEDYGSFILVKIIDKTLSAEKDLFGKHLKHSVIKNVALNVSCYFH